MANDLRKSSLKQMFRSGAIVAALGVGTLGLAIFGQEPKPTSGDYKTGGRDRVGEHAINRSIETQTMLTRLTATKLQRQVAEQNARTYIAKLSPEKKEQLKKKKVRYLAVSTVPSKKTSPKAQEVLMIWDVPTETLAGENVYELSTTPEVGKLASYDDMVAEYVEPANSDESKTKTQSSDQKKEASNVSSTQTPRASASPK
jgi:hypothetical protein